MVGPVSPCKADPTSVTAAQVNGTWESKRGEFKIWALGKRRLQVEFSGTHGYNSPMGPMANTGEGRRIASIEADTAVFKPDGAEDECRITMRFTHDKLEVTQIGTCGFGSGVTAGRTYKKSPRGNRGSNRLSEVWCHCL